jgi:inosine-uridine nucleoside N-ribohydrolase
MNRRFAITLASVFFAALSFVGLAASPMGHAQSHASAARSSQVKTPQLVWIDTDIGDDIDDAFALGLVLRSPELKPLGISTAFGDTETRARLVDRYLAAVGRQSIPVTAGVHTETPNVLTQRAYAEQAPGKKYADGVAAMLEAIRKYPNQITLIAIGPLFNIGAAIDRDPATFHKLKRVVIMGGSIVRGYDGRNGERRPADAEWNILQDPKGAAKLFASGVPIFMMPLDSTQIHLLEPERKALFAAGNPLTTQLDLLYQEWSAKAPGHPQTPTLFDPVAAAYTFRPELCPTTPMRIEVDAKGFTRKVDGAPNAQVCLKSDEAAFLKLLLRRLEQAGNLEESGK